MEVIGTLKEVFDTQQISDRFKKREIVITTEANTPYPQHVSFQLTQDKCDLVNGYGLGQEVKAQFNLRGREWSGPQGVKYFNTLEIWRIERFGNISTHEPNNDSVSGNDTANPAPTFQDVNNNDDLPF